jgi:hypothetical protein
LCYAQKAYRHKFFRSEVIFEAKSLKNDFAPKDFFQSTLLPQSGKQSDLSVMGIFRDFRSYQYNNAVDKKQAVIDIIELKNPLQFLEKSGYDKKF